MSNFFKNWKWYELTFLVVSLATIVLCFVIGTDKNYLSLCTSIVGICGVACLSKGLVFAPYINVVLGVLYSILSYTQNYYGEMIVYLAFIIPMNIVSIILWLKNRKDGNSLEVKVNKVSGLEYALYFFALAVLSVAFYFLLRALNTSALVVSTLSIITLVAAQYLVIRRSSFYAIGFILNDMLAITLWSISVSEYGVEYLPTVICFCVYFVNDVYGLIHWKVEEKKQMKTEEIGETNG